MKLRLLVCLCLVLALPTAAWAELKITLKTARTSYLLFEPAFFEVEIRNDTQDIVYLQGDKKFKTSWLGFMLYDSRENRVDKDLPLELKDEVLLPGESKSFAVNIIQHYAIRTSGTYAVMANIRTDASKTYQTSKILFSIERGQRLWQMERKVQGVMRKYELIRYEIKKHPHIYIQVSEPENNIVYGAFNLGKHLGIADPKVMFDATGNVHILHAMASRAYRYSVVDAKGQILKNENRASGASQPNLSLDDSGSVALSGGIRAEDMQREKLSALQMPGEKVPTKLPELEQ